MASHPPLPGDAAPATSSGGWQGLDPAIYGPAIGPPTAAQQEARLAFAQDIFATPPDAPGSGQNTRTIDIGNGLIAVQVFENGEWFTISTTRAPTGGGGGGGPPGPTAAELDIARRRNDLIQSQQDLDRQMADADRALEALQTRLAQANADRDAAIAAGDLDLARERETRIGEIEQQRVQIERDRFGLDQQRFGLQQQTLQLDRDIFDQQSQQFQQTFGMSMQEFLNNQALGQQGIALNAAALGISAQGQAADAVLGAGELFGSLGADLGDLEFRRDELLASLAANPRDFAQLNRELGGGTSFLQQLFGEEAVTGQSTRLIGEQTLGPAFDALVASLMQRPELEFFEQAGERAGDIPTFEELAGVEVPEAFFPEGPPLPPEPGFVDPATVGADIAGLLPPDPLTAPPPPVGAPTVDGSFQVPGLEGDFTFDVQQGEQGGLSQVLEALRGLSPEAAPLTVADAQLAAQQGDTAEAERIANLLLQGG